MLGYQYLTHHFGSSEPNTWIITEYADVGEIHKAEEWAEERFEKLFPDSAQRAAINDEFTEKFGEYYGRHTDNVLSGQVRRMK